MQAMKAVLGCLEADIARLTAEHREAVLEAEKAKCDVAAKWAQLCAATNLRTALDHYRTEYLVPEEKP